MAQLQQLQRQKISLERGKMAVRVGEEMKITYEAANGRLEAVTRALRPYRRRGLIWRSQFSSQGRDLQAPQSKEKGMCQLRSPLRGLAKRRIR